MGLPRQLFVNRHEVIGFPSRFGEFLLQKLIEGLQIVDSPILTGPHFAEVAAQLYKAGIPLPLRRPFPVQNLVDLLEHKQSSTLIQSGCHW